MAAALFSTPLATLCQQATPAVKVLSFNAAQIGIAAGPAQTLTVSFAVTGASVSFAPTATLHYGHDYSLSPVTCTGGASETCITTVTFRPSLPGPRKDAIFLMDGTTRLATVLLGGIGQGPMSLLQPGAFSTSIPSSTVNTSGYNYIYQSVADENGTVYLLASGNADFIYSVTKSGVTTKLPLTNPPYYWTVGIDGAGVLYLFNESKTVTTYDTVQGIQGTYSIPYGGPDTNWYPGAVGEDNTIYIVDQLRNNGAAYEFKPDNSIGYDVTLDPGVLQPFTATVDSAGNFFVGGYEINRVTPAGVQTQVNTVGASEGLAVDAADTLYATRYSPTGGVAELPASNYTTAIASIDTSSSPLGMSLGSDGTVYVSNYINLDIFDRSKTETVNFGEVDAGKSSTVSTATVYNGGNQPLTISGFTPSGADFSLDPNASNECAAGTVLAPGALCQASVVFSPTHAGGYMGTISVTSNSLNGYGAAQTIQLNGTSDGSFDIVSPDPLVFPSQTPGTSKTLAVTLTNKGSFYASTIYSVASDNSAFTIAQGTCSGVAIAVGASCQLQVTFSPTTVGTYTGDATIVTYVAGTAQAAQTIALPLSGTGVGPIVATPLIAPGTGTYTSSQKVTISDTTSGATIYYTTDSSIPSTNSTKYIGAITVNTNETVNALATAAGYTQSAVASATYTFHEAVATVTPTALSFGNQIQGIASAAQTVTLKNTGIGILTLTGFTITGSAEFSQTNNCAATLTAGNSCTLSIIYTPASLGSKTAMLTVNSDSISAAPTVKLTGTGIAQPPVFTISPVTLDFGNQVVNTSSPVRVVTFTNGSTTDTVEFTSFGLTGGGDAIFEQPGSTCFSPVAPGKSCTLPFVFDPKTVQTYHAMATVTLAVSSCGGCVRSYPTQTFNVTGIGIAPPSVFTISPATLDFGNQVVNTASGVRLVTFTNISNTDTVAVGTIALAGMGLDSISEKPGSTCFSPVAPGKSCTVPFLFAPKANQTYKVTATVMVQAAAGCAACIGNYAIQTFNITGVGVAAPQVLSISPFVLDFGEQPVNTRSAPRSVTVTNISTTDTINLYEADGGTNFMGDIGSCPGPLAPGASCSVAYTFAPGDLTDYTVIGTIKARPTLCTTGACSNSYALATFDLIGSGTLPLSYLLPYSLSFTTAAATDSAAQTVVLSDYREPLYIVDGISITGPNANLYHQTNNCGLFLIVGDACSITVTFTPTGPGDYPATLQVLSNDPTSPQTVSLYGVSIGPPVMKISPATLDFGDQPYNSRSAEQYFTVTNTSSTDTIYINEIEGGLGFDFDRYSCPGVLAPGGSCPIGFTFLPTQLQTIESPVTIKARPEPCPTEECFDLYAPASINLIGNGITPLSYVAPSSLNFTATVGTTSATHNTIIENEHESFYVLNGISITGPNASLYHQTNTCGLYIPAPGACTIKITFTPTAPGDYPATLQVLSNSLSSPQTVSLNGYATAARFPPLFDFSNNFAPETLTLNGPATVAGGALQLTSGPSSAASSVFYPTRVSTKNFDTQFTFQLLDPTAEGITFTIQGDGPNAVGTGGAGLGYQGLARSIAVKFDLKDNASEGDDSTGIYINGVAPTVPAVSLSRSGIDLHNGRVFSLHLSYDGTTLSVSLTDTLTQAVWTTTAQEDIPGIVGGDTAYFGFTAGSGTPALTSNATAKLAAPVRPASAARDATPATSAPQAPAASNILSWIFVANGATKTAQSIYFPSLPAQIYGAAPISLAATSTSGLPVGYSITGPAQLSGSTLTIIGAGEVTVIATQPGNARFSPAAPVTQSFAVAKAPLTVTANDQSRVFGAANPPLTYRLSGFVYGDTASVVSGTAVLTTTAVPASPTGGYPIIFSTESLSATNYSFEYVAGTLTITSATCETVNYSTGFTAAGLSLNDGAAINGNALELTDGGLFEARSAFFTAALPTTSFTTDFTFQITDPVADGMTFVIQSNNPRVVGQSGGGLGYAGIPHSVAIKVDLYNNVGEGTDSTGIYIDGAYPSKPAIDLTPARIDLHSGHIFAGHLAYANGVIKGTIKDTVTGVSASMNFPGDITKAVGNNAWFGFTGGTGGKSATQKILSWSYSGGAGCSAKQYAAS